MDKVLDAVEIFCAKTGCLDYRNCEVRSECEHNRALAQKEADKINVILQKKRDRLLKALRRLMDE